MQYKTRQSARNAFKCAALLLGLAVFQNAARADVATEQAKGFFKQYTKLADNFDPAVADLYADTAVIRNTRIYPNGQARTLTLTGKQLKALVRQIMPMAKARNDRDTYSQLKYQRIGNKVRISGLRYSLMKKYTSPFTTTIAADAKKKWLIVEEISQSRP
jgi:hypothetical protein